MFRTKCQLRSNDFDVLGHLNQSVYHVLLEDARVRFVYSRLPRTFSFVIARIELDHLAEIPLGNTEVEAGLEVTRMGTSSFDLNQNIWRTDGTLAASGKAVFVCWDPERRGSRPLTDEERAVLQNGAATL